MGDIFSLGFGPFRWICASGLESDLQETDRIAEDMIKKLMSKEESMYSMKVFYFIEFSLINSTSKCS